MNNKLNLLNTHLFIIDCVNPDAAIDSTEICKYYANFKSVNFLTSCNIEYIHKVNINKINSILEYNRFILYDLINYLNDVKSDEHILIVQHDGFILNPKSWDNIFYNYDYIGAPWKLRNWVLGNGGFSLRSKKLIETVSNIVISGGYMKTDYPEDFIICGYLRENLEKKYKINFSPNEVAFKFSAEDVEEWSGEFGFHNFKKINLKRDGWVPPEIDYKTNRFLNYFKD